MKKTRLRPWVIILISLIFVIGIIYYSYEVFIWYLHTNDNKEIEKEIIKNITVDKDNNSYSIDFKALKEINSDTVAYIEVNNTNINYVVVKGENNNYYLNHNFEKKWNVAGWVFADYRNKLDETDKNIIIYGHNIKNGSMFSTLINVLDKKWYENKDNHIINFITEDKTYKYQVFSTYSIVPEDYYITTHFNNNKEYLDFLKTIKNRSIYQYEVEINENDKILTLSSCIGEGEKRVVLHAKLIENNS